MVTVSDRFIFKVACQDDYVEDEEILAPVNYDKLDPSVSRNPDGTEKITEEEGAIDDETEKDFLSSLSLKTMIIIGASVVGVFFGGFIIYKCYKSCCKNTGKVTTKTIILSPKAISLDESEFDQVFPDKSTKNDSKKKSPKSSGANNTVVSRKKVKIGALEK